MQFIKENEKNIIANNTKELEISNATVKVHKGRVMEKLKVNSLQDLVKIAIKHALH